MMTGSPDSGDPSPASPVIDVSSPLIVAQEQVPSICTCKS